MLPQRVSQLERVQSSCILLLWSQLDNTYVDVTYLIMGVSYANDYFVIQPGYFHFHSTIQKTAVHLHLRRQSYHITISDQAFGLTSTSRLGCQFCVGKQHEGILVKLPLATRNFYVVSNMKIWCMTSRSQSARCTCLIWTIYVSVGWTHPETSLDNISLSAVPPGDNIYLVSSTW